ncbi:MAG TPA: tRNA (N(6)-L-threonylcarbamoyladenosine(37)-C(2))-methylthiotransferase MtaB [Saprospiraceae bacterium]|nr:tRNA (N(6)-L-threonylcarbamoyladenosine(37)-C(2))-methylthiotransferase MtaB [Saprospiraceae bacterium]HMX89320.1 tRNA (N(6)-L-threonylcarbamoyladenosine(37)-C(2))-methylthiotransferase MtaB [Saprospiraceae bacterium]HMZ41224.1 tRNA (N(6)-L-threonylcarbamoyladenosine(37)-C(2))-methylthiotransferase MtaB [Saprospiraceae bacterium]HNA64916.1 tRNA (N(6)-L-threonylcarbamoyladenosine(37)-C(2))-methylthiotransferase MtaB [Saprospiraceae bacterium]HNB30830.1 tRNA (N(6)-L-threonylcarbamoyladenosine(
MSTSRTVAFHTLGCKLNFSETSSINSSFRSAGYHEVDFEEPADIYVINTCSVTDQADRKCRKVIRAAKRNNPDSKVIVIGCYAQLKPEEISNISGVNLVLGASEKFNILEHIQELDLQSFHSRVISSPINEVKQFEPSYSKEGRTRAFLKVQDGCDYKCSFCTIPKARGRSRSGTIAQIKDLAKQIIEQGAREIVLTGVNIGDFGNGTEVIEGLRPKKEELFIDLIRELDTLDGDFRFRISSIEPNLCTEEIIQFVAASRHFMPHFHMPLQSGDNEILSAMKRRYKRELFADRVDIIKRIMPNACIGVDVIVGFPGENDKHFANTFSFLEKLDVSYLHVFSYSERSDTPAAVMNHSVPEQIRAHRSQALRQLSIKKKHHFYRKNLGQVGKVLIEAREKDGVYSGFTENYVRVQISGTDEKMINQLVPVALDTITPQMDVRGKILI